MNHLKRLLAAALAAFFIAGAALAQNAGTVALNAFAVGNGPGTQGFKSLLCTGFAVGTGSGAAPTCRVIASADIPASVALTGAPTAPTAAIDTNSTQLATTAFVLGQAASATPLIDGTAAVGTSTRYGRADHVHPTDTTRSAVASPTFTGIPAAPTAAVDTNTTQLATTAYVIGQAASATPLIDGTAAVGASTRFARGDHVHPTDSTRAPLASPALTGTPTAPTATPGTNTTQLATTAYADAIAALKANANRNIATGCGLAGGGDLSADRTLKLSLTINAQTGTSYTVVDGDCGKLVSLSNASAVAVTLPQANGSTFVSGWSVDFQNKGAGTVTVTPTTSTINGAASQVLTQNQGMHCQSDGTNYTCMLGVGAGGGAGTVTQVVCGTGLTGGTITASGTCALSVPVSVANGGTGDTGTAWASWTPTITAGTGTFTTVSCVCAFKTIGKTVHMRGAITITSIGTASAALKFTLPATANGPSIAHGADNTVLYQVWINTGNAGSSSTVAVVLTTAGSGPVANINTNGAVFYFSATYEST
jgi:hypothetical protein